MKIEMQTKERSTLEDFADKHGLTMVVKERSKSDMGSRWNEGCRFFASFKDCEVKTGPILAGIFGNGATPDEAIDNYRNEISEKAIVIGAYTSNRKDIRAPILTA